MNDAILQLSMLMVAAGILWSLLGKNKVATPASKIPQKGWSIKGQESFALIVLGFVLMVVALYVP